MTQPTAEPTLRSDPTASGTTRPDDAAPRLRVVVWRDELVDGIGHDVRGPYLEQFWISTIGPTAGWLLRHFDLLLATEPDGVDVDLPIVARRLGIGWGPGRTNPLTRAIQRLVIFGLAQPYGSQTLAVRRCLPPLAARQLARLPASLQAEHRSFERAVPRTDVALSRPVGPPAA